MAKLCLVFLLISLLAAMSWAQSSPAQKWAKRVESQQGTVTNLQFYFHDVLSGKNPTAVQVAQTNDTHKSPTLFGAIMMADDPLTEGPDPNSKLVGRAQGLYGSAGQTEVALMMAMNFGFTDGEYNGSSISLLGRNPAMNPEREMAIVGGTGVFRLARGYAIARTYSFDPTTGDAIVGYNVTVVHDALNSTLTDTSNVSKSPSNASKSPLSRPFLPIRFSGFVLVIWFAFVGFI